MYKQNNGGTGITFLSLLQIAFIVLKLLGKIDWPLWAVFLPLWGPFALIAAIALIVALVASFMKVYRRRHTKQL